MVRSKIPLVKGMPSISPQLCMCTKQKCKNSHNVTVLSAGNNYNFSEFGTELKFLKINVCIYKKSSSLMFCLMCAQVWHSTCSILFKAYKSIFLTTQKKWLITWICLLLSLHVLGLIWGGVFHLLNNLNKTPTGNCPTSPGETIFS